jgi:glycopeptide antibiotics resistance protein
MVPIEPRLYTIYLACITSIEMLKLMPQTDMIDEISNTLDCQKKVLECIIYKQHFNTHDLTEIIESLNEVGRSIRQLKQKDE